MLRRSWAKEPRRERGKAVAACVVGDTLFNAGASCRFSLWSDFVWLHAESMREPMR